MVSIPQSEYLRPQFVRPEWLCLNGKWEFEIDTGFMLAVWYREEITVPDAWQGRQVLLHFGAVDYDATA